MIWLVVAFICGVFVGALGITVWGDIMWHRTLERDYKR
jgi:hypothetical protein